jgi:hypothetical protein
MAFAGVDESAVITRLRALAFGLLNDLARQAGKPVWAEKTAFNAFYIDEIETLCAGQCRFICMYRHGMDVAVSTHELCEKMQMYPPELHDYVKSHPWPLEAFAAAWLDVSRRLKRFATDHSDRCLEMRYEDLVAQPAAQLARICDFLDAPAEPDQIIAAASHRHLAGLGDWKTYQTREVSNRSIGRWRRLPVDVIARVAQTVNSGLELLGYEPVAIPRSLSPAASRRALQLSLLAAGLRSARDAGGPEGG